MSRQEMDRLGTELIKELLKDGERSYTKKWAIERQGRPTDEEIVVVVIRSKKGKLDRISEAIKSVPDAVALQPSGTPCPMCKGSGRI